MGLWVLGGMGYPPPPALPAHCSQKFQAFYHEWIDLPVNAKLGEPLTGKSLVFLFTSEPLLPFVTGCFGNSGCSIFFASRFPDSRFQIDWDAYLQQRKPRFEATYDGAKYRVSVRKPE